MAEDPDNNLIVSLMGSPTSGVLYLTTNTPYSARASVLVNYRIRDSEIEKSPLLSQEMSNEVLLQPTLWISVIITLGGDNYPNFNLSWFIGPIKGQALIFRNNTLQSFIETCHIPLKLKRKLDPFLGFDIFSIAENMFSCQYVIAHMTLYTHMFLCVCATNTND